MQLYEMLFIIKNDYSDDQVTAVVDSVIKNITSTSTDAEIVSKDLLGRKRLAYAVKKETNGFYALIIFKAPHETIHTLNRACELNDSLLRHLIIRKEEKSPEQLAKEEKLREKVSRAHAERLASEKQSETRVDSPASKKLVQKKEDLVSESTPDTVEHLEEKLDEILKRDIVE